MPSFIVFTLAGPMASFGTVAGNERRGTESRPGHSMLTGLMAAALGLRRDQSVDLAALSDACMFAVRVDRPGHLMTDFHTAQSAKRKKVFAPETRRQMLDEGERTTIVTKREYLCDARFTIAVAFSHPQLTPGELIQHLKQPRFTLYLGRKSCPPALPLYPKLIDVATIDAALERYDEITETRAACFWDKNARALRVEAPSREVAIDARLATDHQAYRSERRRVRPVDRGSWRFDPLEELVLAAPKSTIPSDEQEDR